MAAQPDVFNPAMARVACTGTNRGEPLFAAGTVPA